MNDAVKTEHIKGRYLLIVALIGFLGVIVGLFVKGPIEKEFFPKYANIGGVWKAHGDLIRHCEISTVRDSFYLNLRVSYESGDYWVIDGMVNSTKIQEISKELLLVLKTEVLQFGDMQKPLAATS